MMKAYKYSDYPQIISFDKETIFTKKNDIIIGVHYNRVDGSIRGKLVSYTKEDSGEIFRIMFIVLQDHLYNKRTASVIKA